MIKRILCLLLLCALLLSGCGAGREAETAAASSAIVTSATAEAAEPQSEPPAEPPAETETEAPFETPTDREAAIALFEGEPYDYTPLEREPEQPAEPLPPARYSLGADGVWRSDRAGDGRAVLLLTGDLMCQTLQQQAARTASGYDFRRSFDFVRPIFARADFVVGNLEAVLSEHAPYMSEQKEVEERPHLNAPASFLEGLRWAGFDAVVMSNNHNCDAGARGIYDTLDRVDEYGLMHTGLFRSERESRWTLAEVDGIRVGLLSYATYFNRKQQHLSPEGQELLLNRYSAQRAREDIARLREAGAEFVIVYAHWGKEYTNEPNEKQTAMALELAEAGADFIVGSHPHALQPYARIACADGREVPVVYSMGNFVSHQSRKVSKDTLILRLVLKRDKAGNARLTEQSYIPCEVFPYFQGKDYVVVPVVYPYNLEMSSPEFGPAYRRITAVLGPELEALGKPE